MKKACLRNITLHVSVRLFGLNLSKKSVQTWNLGISLLYKELGVVDAVRFLKQFTQGYGNYTQGREVHFADKSLEEIVSEIEKRRKSAKRCLSAV